MRITFNKTDAGHIYEYLRFYWEDDFLRHPEDRNMGKFGGCGLCISIGKRLERFIGEKEVKFVEKLVKKHRKENSTVAKNRTVQPVQKLHRL